MMVLPPFPSSSALRDGNSQENKKKKQSKKHRRLSAAQRVPGRTSPGYRMLDDWG